MSNIIGRTPFYSWPRMIAYLQQNGHRVNHKRVQRLMQRMDVPAVCPKPRTTVARSEHRLYPDLLRGIVVTHSNRLWSADITYLPMLRGFMHLVAILDWFSRLDEPRWTRRVVRPDWEYPYTTDVPWRSLFPTQRSTTPFACYCPRLGSDSQPHPKGHVPMMAPDEQWCLPPSDLTLCNEQVHIWRLSLEQPAGLVHQLSQLLSADEQTRAERFHFERDRRRFIVGRGALRIMVGRYLGACPVELRFRYEPHGKPHLSAEFERSDVRFNLAHSGELAVYAFTLGHELGIDLEFVRSLPDAESIAARFFSAQENIVLHTLPESQRCDAFFNCWTRKEAYIKAIGDGLSHPLNEFQVSFSPEEPARLLTVRDSPEEATRWSMASCVPAPGYVAALAVEGVDYRLDCWHCLLGTSQTSDKLDLMLGG